MRQKHGKVFSKVMFSDKEGDHQKCLGKEIQSALKEEEAKTKTIVPEPKEVVDEAPATIPLKEEEEVSVPTATTIPEPTTEEPKAAEKENSDPIPPQSQPQAEEETKETVALTPQPKKPKKLKLKAILSKYIENPMLIENRKFDLRVFVLIASANPLVVLFHPGYLKRSLVEFDKAVLVGDQAKMMHITNDGIQRKSPDYKERRAETVWSMD